MNIVCCVKQVPDTNIPIRLAPGSKDIDRSELTYILNPYDEYAVEEALRIREAHGGEVTAVMVGPKRSEETLRFVLAMGADKAIWVEDERMGLQDPLVTAWALSRVLQKTSYDLILCGREAIDDNAFQVGGALAQFLGIPALSVASKVTVDLPSKKVVVERSVEGGVKQVVEADLPCVISAQKGLNEPRYASLSGIMKAKKKEIAVIKWPDLGVDLTSRVQFVDFALPLESRKRHLVEVSAVDGAAKGLVQFLREEAKVV